MARIELAGAVLLCPREEVGCGAVERRSYVARPILPPPKMGPSWSRLGQPIWPITTSISLRKMFDRFLDLRNPAGSGAIKRAACPLPATGDRGFESPSLQRKVCELSVPTSFCLQCRTRFRGVGILLARPSRPRRVRLRHPRARRWRAMPGDAPSGHWSEAPLGLAIYADGAMPSAARSIAAISMRFICIIAMKARPARARSASPISLIS